MTEIGCRLALGTAQFGLRYGVANTTGQVGPDEATAILLQARAAGVDTLDTAIAYGSSEARLGELGVAGWRVITKLPGVPVGIADVAGWVRASVSGSLERLRTHQVAGLLLHRPHDLLGPHGAAIETTLRELKEQKTVEKVGVSVYSPDEIGLFWPRFTVDLVQSPFSVFDRRLAESGWMSRLHAAGIEVHVRSVFLQGLLLLNRADRPSYFHRWESLWRQWESWLFDVNLTPLQVCLRFAASHSAIDRLVVGVDGVGQLREILATGTAGAEAPPPSLASEDLDLINPTRWPTR